MANRTYLQIAKGRGYVYAYQDQLYRQVKKHGEVRYLKCCIDPCDGSAKIKQGELITRVSVLENLCHFLSPC